MIKTNLEGYDAYTAMALARSILVALLLSFVSIAAEKGELELRGQIIPPLRNAWVGIQSATTPFRKQSLSGMNGQFKFKKLIPGSYTVVVFHPHWGEQRRTVQVTPSFVDEKNRVPLTVLVKRSKKERERHLDRRHTVSAQDLSVSPEARSEFRKAGKKLEKHDTEGAVAHLQNAVEISPQFMSAWNHLGTIEYQSGRYPKAEEYFRIALDLKPDAFPPVVNLGAALLALERHDEALRFNQYAVTLHTDDALANSQLGRNFFRLGNADEAIHYLKIAKRLDPFHFSLPQITLAEIYRQRGEHRKAIRELEDFVEKHPDSQQAALTRQTLARLKEAGLPSPEDQGDRD